LYDIASIRIKILISASITKKANFGKIAGHLWKKIVFLDRDCLILEKYRA